MSDSHTGFTRSDEWFESNGVRCAAAVYRPNGRFQVHPKTKIPQATRRI